MKTSRITLLFLAFALLLCACGSAPESSAAAETVPFTDDCGRTVELPTEITRVAPSGAAANMFLAAAAPEYMVCVSDAVTTAQQPYLDPRLRDLPVTGSLYGGKGDANLEALLAAAPQLIIDMGDLRSDTAQSLDALQEQIGVPCVFLKSDIADMADAFRDLGVLLSGKAERCAVLADYVEETVLLAQSSAAAIPENDRVRVMFTAGADGLGANSRGSTQAQVIELVGGINAVETAEVVHKSGGNPINPEQLYLFAPDVILFAPDSIYASVAADATWAQLEAVRTGQYYEVPTAPYNWLSNPPSMNMLLGIRWLGKLLYPAQYDFDLTAEVRRAYQILWNYDLTEAETEEMLANSVRKQ